MPIKPEDHARWNLHGTNQQDSLKAGTIYGANAEADQFTKAAQEQVYANFRNMDQQRSAEMALNAQGVFVPPMRFGASAKIFVTLMLAPVLVIAFFAGTGAITAPDANDIDRTQLIQAVPDPGVYATRDSDVLALTGESTSRLLEKYFIGQPQRSMQMLSNDQRAAVQAMWLQYVRNPASFLSLKPNHQSASLELFDSYLLSLGGKTSGAAPYIDRGRIYLSGLDRVNVPLSAREKRARDAWLDGAIALPRNSQLQALIQGGQSDNAIYRLCIRGWHFWKGLLPVGA